MGTVRGWHVAAAIFCLASVGAGCKSKPTLQVTSPFTVKVGSYKNAEIKVVAEEEKSAPYATRLATQLIEKLKMRDTFEKYRLPTDEGKSDLMIQVTIQDLKKASRVSWGWYTRNTSRVETEVVVSDPASGQSVAVFQVIAKPRYSNVEEAIEDAAIQIADFIRQNK